MQPSPPASDRFPRGFASDNFAGVHPSVMAALADCNHGHAGAYGDDPLTAEARAAFDRLLGRPVSTHFVFNGTAANVLALSAFARSYGAVLCSDAAHIANDESTAPERTLGMRVIPLASRDGKLDPAALAAAVGRGHGVHGARPVVLSLTQPTELGTVYSPQELRRLVGLAHEHGLGVHVDGARIGCAAAALDLSLGPMLAETGVDALSFGGTKQGMMFGEAVVFLTPGLGGEFPYWQKHALQLASKMRFVSAQFLALLAGDLWLDNGRRANAAASRLAAAVTGIPGLEIVFPVQANAVFARLPPDMIAPLQRRSFFWPWDERSGLVRWMCAFDTTSEDVEKFAGIVRQAMKERHTPQS